MKVFPSSQDVKNHSLPYSQFHDFVQILLSALSEVDALKEYIICQLCEIGCNVLFLFFISTFWGGYGK